MSPIRRSINLVVLAAFVVGTCALEAQTYQIGSGGTATQANQTSSDLGWGSNIENTRIAHAAQNALQHGDYARALALAQQAAGAAPNDAQIWFLLGYAARLNSKYQTSVDGYLHGLRLKPSSLEGKSGLAQTYIAMKRNADAEKLLEQVLGAAPNRSADALLLGNLYLQSGNYDAALRALGRAEKLKPDARSELLMAICYERTNHPDLAHQYLTAAKKRAPDNPDVQRTLAGYFRDVGQYDQALNSLLAIRHPTPDIIAELAYTYKLDGKLKDSAQYYVRAANSESSNVDLQISAARAEFENGSTERAVPFLRRAAKLAPSNYKLHALKGEIAQSQQHPEEAIAEYNATLAALPQQPSEGPLYGIQLHMDLADLYKNIDDTRSSSQKVAEAQQEIDALDSQAVPRAPFLRLRARIELASEHPKKAFTDISDALAIDSHSVSGLQLDGDVLMKLDRPEDAAAAYTKVLSIDSHNRYALTSLGYAERASGHLDMAEKHFRRLAQYYPNFYVPYLALGDLLTTKKQYKQAQVMYEKAQTLVPDNPSVVAGGMNAAIEDHNIPLAGTWFTSATPNMSGNPYFLREKERYLSFKGDYAQSLAAGKKAITVLPNDRDVVVYLGYDMLHLERWDDLLALAEKYEDLMPKEPDFPLFKGYVHKQRGQEKEAVEDFSEAIKRESNTETAYVNRGYLYNDLKRPQAAESDFQAALKRDPKDGEAYLGLAYADLNLHRTSAAIHNADLADSFIGESRNSDVVRATAYARDGMLASAGKEYRAALQFTPNDASLHLAYAGTLYSARRYRDAVQELDTARQFSPEDPDISALLARSYANLGDRDQTFHYVRLAESQAQQAPPPRDRFAPSVVSSTLISTGQALSTIGEQQTAMVRFRKALELPQSNRVAVRLAIADTLAKEGKDADVQREIALAIMESAAGDALPPNGNQYIQAAGALSSIHQYDLAQRYLQHAKAAGAPDAEVHIGLANNYLALGETAKANAELAAIRSGEDEPPTYQLLLARANLYRQQHHDLQAFTSFAQATEAEGEDQVATRSLLQAGANEGLRITPAVSVLSNFEIMPVFEDSTVYVLDAKLDAAFPVSGSNTSLLPPPRSSLQTQSTNAFHLHVNRLPESGGFIQVRNMRGQISVPATNSIVHRNTTDYTLNFGLSPTVHLGSNIITFDGGVQSTFRRDSLSPVQMNQNLFRTFVYVNTSSFFNAVSASGFLMRETGPFTESRQHSRGLAAAINFRVGAPWGKTALLAGWGANDQLFTPENYENYFTSTYIGIERHFSPKFQAQALFEDLRAWRVVNGQYAIAQTIRPSLSFDYTPAQNWFIQASTALSSPRGFHAYNLTRNGFTVSYSLPIKRRFHDDSRMMILQYPIRFSAGLQQETFFNFNGKQNQQLRPFVQISIF